MTAAAAPLASLRARFAALFYEVLLLVAIVLIASFALTPFVSPQGAATHELVVPSPAGRTISLLALFALGAALYAWTWSEGRRTLPMKTWHLALVTVGGAPLTRGRALLRYLAAWIAPAAALGCFVLLRPHGLGALAWPLLALNWLAAFVDRDRQFLHDRMARTRLVRA